MRHNSSVPTASRKFLGPFLLVFLSLITLVFAVRRGVVDLPNVATGNLPPEGSIDHGYALHPVLAYLHIIPGVFFLLGAPFQLSRRFRSRHMKAHRVFGRVLVVSALVAGVYALVIGAVFPFGGLGEATATWVFGVWFLICLVKGFGHARRREIAEHRAWMIRAVAMALAVGSIRIWIGLFEGFGVLESETAFAAAFWIAFLLHAAGAEWWLARE